MALPDPALGFSVDFPTETFENAIKFAMQMGAPTGEVDGAPLAPRFIKKGAGRTYWRDDEQLMPISEGGTLRLDRDGRPFDPNVRIGAGTDDEVLAVDCAIEIDKADADEIPVGNFRPTKAIVTLLDADYLKIVGVRELAYNGDRYTYGYEPEALGLFDAGVHTMIFYAQDET